jgi:hypothetical protein
MTTKHLYWIVGILVAGLIVYIICHSHKKESIPDPAYNTGKDANGNDVYANPDYKPAGSAANIAGSSTIPGADNTA